MLIDLPVDVTMEKCEEVIPAEVELPGYKPRYEGNIRQIKHAAEVINSSKQPVVYTGGGIITSECSKELLGLSEKGNLPGPQHLWGLVVFLKITIYPWGCWECTALLTQISQ